LASRGFGGIFGGMTTPLGASPFRSCPQPSAAHLQLILPLTPGVRSRLRNCEYEPRECSDVQTANDRELAAALGVARTTLWRAVKAGTIPAPIYVAGRNARWPLQETVEAVMRLAAQRPRPEPRRRRVKGAA
jgi:predicted DNA-binding transcriptional regulator AlpA